jgi:hypothetical protein
MKKLAVCLICVAFIIGCGSSHYKITDPSSKNVYFAEGLDEMDNGAIKFRDAKTGSDVILQSSEVKEVDEKTFNEGIKPPQTEEKKVEKGTTPAP